MLVTDEREENHNTKRKNPHSKARTNNKLNPVMTPGPGFETKPHW